MTPNKNKSTALSLAQIKRIEEALCQIAIDGRGPEALTQMRKALVTEFLALNATPVPVLTPN
jgi:hypothetical protein